MADGEIDERVRKLFDDDVEVVWHSSYDPGGVIADVRGRWKGNSNEVVVRHMCTAAGNFPDGWASSKDYESGNREFRDMGEIGSC
jgi:hypothetical protein